MKFLQAAVILAMMAPAESSASQSHLRRAQGNSENGNGNAYGILRRSTVPCTVVLSDIQFEDHHEETDRPLECELGGEDLNGLYHKIVKVNGVPPEFAKAKGLESGVSTIFADGVEIDEDNGSYIIPDGADIQVGRKSNKGRGNNKDELTENGRNLAVVNKKVLVLRVVGSDQAMTTKNEFELSDDVFGSNGDPVNLKSQYAECSYDQFIFDKVANNQMIGDDSVYTVSIDIGVNGADNSVIRDAVTQKAAQDLGGPLYEIADYVMICMPPGTTGSWIAYAFINHWLSVYNNEWCSYLSAQMHEIGHNLGLAHSGETATYDDQSGMMGYSYANDDTPRMCFNGPKTFQLGWFSDFHVELQAASDFSWTGDLIGFSEKDDAGQNDKMIVRIIGEVSGTDAYVHFNRATDFNSGSQEGQGQVLVSTRPEGLGYAVSKEFAKLSSGESYTFNEFNGFGKPDLLISVDSIDKSSAPHRARVTITLGSGVPPTPTPVPPTPSPVPPTPSPVPPTPSPVPDPTPEPVEDPTPAPVPDPTPEPVEDPTWSPVPDPTPAPVPSPPSCDNDGVCRSGEDCNSCPGDCRSQGKTCCVGGTCDSYKCNQSQGKSQWVCVI